MSRSSTPKITIATPEMASIVTPAIRTRRIQTPSRLTDLALTRVVCLEGFLEKIQACHRRVKGDSRGSSGTRPYGRSELGNRSSWFRILLCDRTRHWHQICGQRAVKVNRTEPYLASCSAFLGTAPRAFVVGLRPRDGEMERLNVDYLELIRSPIKVGVVQMRRPK